MFDTMFDTMTEAISATTAEKIMLPDFAQHYGRIAESQTVCFTSRKPGWT